MPRTRHYQFLPRASVLRQTGGFAGVDYLYRVEGTFDFTITPTLLSVYPPVFVGDFHNVDAAGKALRGGDEVQLDDAINLSALEGSSGMTQPSHVFRFRGKTLDGSHMELWAALHGPWLYMRGGTTPPEGGADFFEYRIRALARHRPLADLNDDGLVDGADLANLANLAASTGDFGENFLSWQQQYGEAPPSEAQFEAAIAAAALNVATTVPEPASLALIAAVCGCLLRRRHFVPARVRSGLPVLSRLD